MKVLLKIFPDATVRALTELPESASGLTYVNTIDKVLVTCPDEGRIVSVGDRGELNTWFAMGEIPEPDAICTSRRAKGWKTGAVPVFVRNRGGELWLILPKSKNKLVYGGKVAAHTYNSLYKSKTACKPCSVDICHINMFVLAAYTDRHVVVKYRENSHANVLLGTGVSGFETANEPENCVLNSPAGIAYDQKNQTIWLADSGNNMLRLFSLPKMNPSSMYGRRDSKEIVDGSLQSARFFRPTNMSMWGDSIGMIDNDGQALRKISIIPGTVETVWSTQNRMTAISVDSEQNILAIEER